ncbi:voltage-dependent calcium channel subunit alpha-2/delta-4-like isoform X1 [Cydia splendana]|uniref:voltage-dependent calcium channel subunit alpha-2/delta-4-like isoform X1 n=1 Tax=Cydia splendana TaxID=1100963 RepID=UPI002143BCEB
MREAGLALCALLILLPEPPVCSQEPQNANIVREWGRTLGMELWKLNQALTKADKIRHNYKTMNASVKQKDGGQILRSSLTSVGTMLTKKINAVKCIHATAIELAREFNGTVDEDFQYCSAKYSEFMVVDEYTNETTLLTSVTEKPAFVIKENRHYETIYLENDSHFYDIAVNINRSCVHIPTNIYFKDEDAKNAIHWTRGLNDVFIKNYQADPSLSWQYFGTTYGILRFFPAMPWNMRKTDTYDCRVQSWYIEAATCSKDVVVLFDISGSMTGFKNYVARTTLKSLLDTLSNNDYVNVYTVSDNTDQVMNCSEGLVQATKENIGTLMDILTPTDEGKNHKIPLNGIANFTKAYIKAFATLKERRNETDCNVASTGGCNQLVMVITDYAFENLSAVFDEHNREVIDGVMYTPVRVFTYLIGREMAGLGELQQMACYNRGYFVHIHSVEEVQQQVLKYINVIALPMILNGSEPPPTWTHASMDHTRTYEWGVSPDVTKPDEDKLVTSVAIPAFDRYNENATLLGVAGTDVPIDSISKLAQPNQLGVNGYSFIVSNNGYLLLHPLLKTSINGALQVNYNSVDFVEVEQVDDGKDSRELGDEIKWLRQNLTEAVNGRMTNIEVLFHYDDMRRISRVKHDYFFSELVGTPFSMGISLPVGYGDTEMVLNSNPLEPTQEDHTDFNVTDFFRYSYRVHPDWVYCKYHYLEGHESDSPEIEVWNFLVNISKAEIDVTRKQYQEETSNEFSVETHCGDAQTPIDKDDYYCNEDLVKQLVFDAKLSYPYFHNWSDYTEHDVELTKKYGVSVRFIMTSSGFTRWHYLYDDDKNEWVDDDGYPHKNYSGKVLGDHYATSIEITPYKAAVLQSMINTESLVVASPLPVLDPAIKYRPPVINEFGDVTLTASYAIFYTENSSDTPASVVGFQFSHSQFRNRFMDISTEENGLSCNSSDYDCYIIDSSGYVVMSMDHEEVGQFFGVIHPLVLQSLIYKEIFEHVEVFNYQTLCPDSMLGDPNCSWTLSTPFTLIKWLLAEFLILLGDLYHWNHYAYANVIFEYEDYVEATTTTAPETEKEIPKEPIASMEDEITFSCDHRISLYILNQTHFLKTVEDNPVTYEDEVGECNPRYWASYVDHTNLLLMVIEKVDHENFSESCEKPPTTRPEPTPNSTDSREPCHKLGLGMLPRRRLEGCFTYHELEANASVCGLATTSVATPQFITFSTLLSALGSRLLCL